MINLKGKTQADFERVGTIILNELNISLLNMEPTDHKAYQIMHRLIEAGCTNRHKIQIIDSIKVFIKKRTASNRLKLFRDMFSIPYTPDLNHHFAMSYRTCLIPEDTIIKVADRIYDQLVSIDAHKYGLSEKVIIEALKLSYKPAYYENEWSLSLKTLHSKIIKVLQSQNDLQFLPAIKEIFYLIDPTIQKKSLTDILASEETQDGTESGSDTENAIANLDIQAGTSVNESKSGDFDTSSLTSKIKIKEGEIRYVQGVLDRFITDPYPFDLDEDLFPNVVHFNDGSSLIQDRHIMVINFHDFTKQYNKKRGSIAISNPEAKAVIDLAKQALLDTGEALIKQYNALINNTVRSLTKDLKE